jgi:hypothetical protein
MGVVKGPEEQKLLMASVDIPMSGENSTNFDQQLEAGYLSHLPAEERIPQLQKEVVTALSELKFTEVGANYEMRNGRLVDSDTGLDLEELIAKGQILAETEAIRKLNKYLIDGEGLVINISPENKLLGYLDNIVDIWKKYTDGKVRVLRYKTEGDLKTFKIFIKILVVKLRAQLEMKY